MKALTISQPVKSPAENERMLLVDILRAIALVGIILNHITVGYLAGPPPPGNPNFNIFSPFDAALNTGSFILTFGKFFTIFSFLFGLSFAIQLDSAARKEKKFTSTFLWRLTILFVIGYIHNLFYSGDILVVYSVLGLLLLPSRFLNNRLVLPFAIMLVLNVPGLIQDVISVSSTAPSAAEIAAQKQAAEGFAQMATDHFNAKQSGSLMDVISANAVGGMMIKFFFQVISGRIWITFGLFLLGMYAGRKKIFRFTPSNQIMFKRLFVWSGIIAVVSTILALQYGTFLSKATTPLQVLGNFSFSVHQAALSAFYVSGIVLLYWKARSKKFMDMFAAVGQMGLTTYLTQSVFGVLMFYGFGLGLLGRIGVGASLAMGLSFFVLQIFYSNWWMARFKYGPVEWSWRSLTYLKLQPLKREQPKIVVEFEMEQAANNVTNKPREVEMA